jgi:dTDP-4-dehydrorhamnose 3,5-epimerase
MFTQLAIPDVILFVPKRHRDSRGWFSEAHSVSLLDAQKFPRFVQDNDSFSTVPGTVRGLHFQRPPLAQSKLVRCVVGAVFDVAVDLRPGSSTFGRHVSVRLDAESGSQVFIPAGFAHGFCTLSPDTLVQYKVTVPYAPDQEGGILWNDPTLGIEWPIHSDNAVLSDKDRALPRLADAML